jgi:hypothetical protein
MITLFKLTKTEAKAYEMSHAQNINVNHEVNLSPPNIVTAAGNNVLRIEFKMNINYLNPSIGYIMLEGTLDYSGENIVEAKDTWGMNEKTTNMIKAEITNTIITNVMPFVLMIGQRLNLPPAIPFPMIQIDQIDKIQKKEDVSAYIG